MIKIGRSTPGQPVTTEMELAGQKFEIDLEPFESRDQTAMFSSFRRTKNVLNPVSKSMEIVKYFDEDGDKDYEKKANEQLCRILHDFRGIGDLDGNLLDGTKDENKLLLGDVRIEDYEEIEINDPDTKETAFIRQKRVRRFRALIFEEAARLASVRAQVSEKNLYGSPENISQASQ